MLLEEGGGDRGRSRPSRAGSSIRSTAPPTSSTACRISRSRSRSRSRCPAASRRSRHGLVYQPLTDESFLGGEGPGRLAQRPAPARLGAARSRRSADRHRHSPFRPRRRRPLVADLRRDRARSMRDPPHRLGRARSRLGRGGPVRRLLGRRSRHLGHRRGRAAGQGSGRFRQRLSRARTGCSSGANIWPRAANCTAGCTSCSPGRFASLIASHSHCFRCLPRRGGVLKRRQLVPPGSPPLASVAAGYLPILLFLGRRAGAVDGVRRAADAGQPPDRHAQAGRGEAQRI